MSVCSIKMYDLYKFSLLMFECCFGERRFVGFIEVKRILVVVEREHFFKTEPSSNHLKALFD